MAKDGFLVLDSDMHVREPLDLWERYIDPEFRSIAPRGHSPIRLGVGFPGDPPNLNAARLADHGHNFERHQQVFADHSSRGWTSECQLEAMDAEGLDVAVLFPSLGLSVLTNPDREPRFAGAIARAYNDWLFEFCQLDPQRLLGAGMISVFDIDDAVRESERVVNEYGFRGVFLRANVVNGKNWHDPFYEPLWDALEDLGIPLGLHEATGGGVQQAGAKYAPSFGLRRIYGQPFENMLAMASFLCGGVLEHHPRLNVAFLEANCSWAPWLLWRMDELFELEGDVYMPDIKMEPSEYFKRQCFLSVEPDELPAKYMIDAFGAENLVFSTDYPHSDCRYPEAVEDFLEMPFSEDVKRKILWDNCARLYSVTSDVRAGGEVVH